MEFDLDKYEISILSNLDKENASKIIRFLIKEKAPWIEDLLERYIDILTFDYIDFIDKYNKLNLKYNNNLIKEISNNMNILEEFYNI